MHHLPEGLPISRRQLLQRSGMGLGTMALAGLLSDDGLQAATTNSPLSPRAPHYPAKAKRVIHFFLNGGPSHVDTFDPKPALKKYEGKPVPNTLTTERKTGAAFPSPFKFEPRGESGIEVSELFARTAEHIDDIAVIRSMYAQVPNHEPSLMLMNCGDGRLVRPSMGSWVTYGLGTENQNLPGFIAMCPKGLPVTETANWRSAFLPGVYQGTYIDTQHTNIEKLIENIRNKQMPLDRQRDQIDLLQALNRRHLSERPHDSALESRIHSFELAYRMQIEAADAFDINNEPKHIREMYGEGVHARQLLIARRLVERGVRFVQIFSGGWDSHDFIERAHQKRIYSVDKPIAALIKDLKARGMLDETLVVWTGEFGRTPDNNVRGGDAAIGRDHNADAMNMFFAGGGVKRGTIVGATDEIGAKAVEVVHPIRDVHVSLLHLLGLDDNKLTYFHGGRFKQLSQTGGEVIDELIA